MKIRFTKSFKFRIEIKDIGLFLLAVFLYSGILFSFYNMVEYQDRLQLISLITASVITMFVFIKYRIKSIPMNQTLLFTVPLILTVLIFHNEMDQLKIIMTIGMFVILNIIGSQLFRKSADLEKFFHYLFILGLLIIIGTLLNGQVSGNNRLSLNNTNPIWLSRSVSFVFFYIVVLYMNKKISVRIMLPTVLLTLYVMITTGSRGPLIAVFFSLLVILSKKIKLNRIKYRTLLWIFLLLFSGIIFIIFSFNIQSDSILNRFMIGNFNNDDMVRLDLYKTSINLILKTPFGIGAGNFIKYSGFRYPHNIIFESFVEYGWIVGCSLIFILVKSYNRFNRLFYYNHIYQIAYGFFILSLINSMISGDLTSPKELYLLIGISYNYKYFCKEFDHG